LPQEIRSLAESLLKDPVRATVGVTTQPVAEVTQVNLLVHTDKKPELLLKELAERQGRILIFTRTKVGTEQLERLLSRAGHVVEFLHGERTQKQRKEALEAFRNGECRILVATDIAARGLDIPGIEHVINYSLPQTREEYIHRVGRTARQGKTGIAVNFVTPRDRNILRKLGKLIGLAEPAREVAAPKPAPTPAHHKRPQKPSKKMNKKFRR
jgi:ATP-dependent RNA helicase RhlE